MTWTDPRFTLIAELLSAETGLTFPRTRQPYAEAAMRRSMAKARVRDPDVYVARLRTEPRLLHALIGQVTVGETYFFRDPAQFDVLRTLVLPEISRRRPADSLIRVWSAGCASGEEAYSLAIVLEELGLAGRSSILATDLSHAAIDKARQGVYASWSFRGERMPWRDRSFVATAGKWVVAPRLRSRIEFAVYNLAQNATGVVLPVELDLIVCRNVLMYFDRATLKRVARTLVRSLTPGGWLVTSPGDPLLPDEVGLEVITTAAGLLYRRQLTTTTVHIEYRPVQDVSPVPDRLSRAIPENVPTATVHDRTPLPTEDGIALRIRTLMRNGAYEDALLKSTTATTVRPLDPELHVLRALLLLDFGMPAEAVVAARRALFLDRSLAVAHLVLGRALRLLGRREGARGALRRVRELLASTAPDESVRFADATSAGDLAASAAAELVLLDRDLEAAT